MLADGRAKEDGVELKSEEEIGCGKDSGERGCENVEEDDAKWELEEVECERDSSEGNCGIKNEL